VVVILRLIHRISWSVRRLITTCKVETMPTSFKRKPNNNQRSRKVDDSSEPTSENPKYLDINKLIPYILNRVRPNAAT